MINPLYRKIGERVVILREYDLKPTSYGTIVDLVPESRCGGYMVKVDGCDKPEYYHEFCVADVGYDAMVAKAQRLALHKTLIPIIEERKLKGEQVARLIHDYVNKWISDGNRWGIAPLNTAH